jgi:hypothetical protein
MTAMLSLQVVYIFRLLYESSRGNREMTRNFARNFFANQSRSAPLRIDHSPGKSAANTKSSIRVSRKVAKSQGK